MALSTYNVTPRLLPVTITITVFSTCDIECRATFEQKLVLTQEMQIHLEKAQCNILCFVFVCMPVMQKKIFFSTVAASKYDVAASCPLVCTLMNSLDSHQLLVSHWCL